MSSSITAAIPANLAWTSPFSRWGLSLSEVNSIDLCADVTQRAFTRAGFSAEQLNEIVFGWTVPQPTIFYGTPTLAVKIGAPGVAGPMISQACATSVAALRAAAESLQGSETAKTILVATTDRTSNGPLLIYPSPSAAGGRPQEEHWVLDNFKADPSTGISMLATADTVAREAGISRDELDAVTALRYEQYFAHQGEHKHRIPVEIQMRKRVIKLASDEGIVETSGETLAKLKPANKDELHSFGNQTHPADGTAGAVITTPERARELAKGEGIVELLGFGICRVASARMPTAPVPAALSALQSAGLSIKDVDLVTTHNPFAVNDVFFSRQTGFPLEKMNLLGCSLVFGHPQGPTGMRSIAELITSLQARGGGVGVFTGCAAGDVGGAVVVRVTD